MSDRDGRSKLEDDATARTLLSSAPADDEPPPVAPGLVIAGRYRIDRLLGSGGMGEVYKAEHLTLGIPVAVKLLRRFLSSDPDLLRRFQREARATSLLAHPNVVRVLDFGSEQGLFFIVMEYLQGESVAAWLARAGTPPPLREVEEVMDQILAALEAAHGAGIVHRDLKPENVFLLLEARDRRLVKVVDFGLAHFDDADGGATLTRSDMVAGTPRYMSPEQCHSLAVGPPADLYAAGCVLTELLQCRPLFDGAAPIEIITKQIFLAPPPLARPAGAEPVPPLLETLRLDLLAKAPEQRPKNATEARRRLREAMSPEATEARLPSRKGDEPLGAREERAPAWEAPASPAPAPASAAAESLPVILVRLARHDAGVSDTCVTGLAAQGFTLREAAGPDDLPGARAAVLDAGSDVASAGAWLARVRGTAGAPKVIVCADGLDMDRMNRLIAAGAADIVTYPVTAAELARKVGRVLRRGR